MVISLLRCPKGKGQEGGWHLKHPTCSGISPKEKTGSGFFQEQETKQLTFLGDICKRKYTNTMEPDFLNAFSKLAKVTPLPQEEDFVPGEKRKFLTPSSRNDPKLEALQTFLINWINTTLKHEHIVVKSLEQDLYDGLVLHHLIEKLGSLTLEVEKFAMTEQKQRLKLAVILKTVSQCLQLEESEVKWSVDVIFRKDLLSTLHLLVAIAEHFQPELPIPPNVNVAVINIESTAHGLKTENTIECITKKRETAENFAKADIFNELLKCAPEKLEAVKQVLLKFVNKHVEKLGLNVTNLDSQLADGVILLLLIGQLQGFFLNLGDFFLNPNSVLEKVHNVNLAVDFMMDEDLLDTPINPEDIVNQDMNATLLVLYCLFSKYKIKGI
ncbi:gamma-parvin isoform X2 [Varanus komodoensis]|uniref:gamma-parvin isoform X2 n=1 Tax=Varanus komodoensis TaxID=61221 RepID=UPI001CF7DCE6|nr:gamma-parvin isoform X2 [Varanus komodoensis]